MLTCICDRYGCPPITTECNKEKSTAGNGSEIGTETWLPPSLAMVRVKFALPKPRLFKCTVYQTLGCCSTVDEI